MIKTILKPMLWISFHELECERSTVEYSILVFKYSLRDLICDVIN